VNDGTGLCFRLIPPAEAGGLAGQELLRGCTQYSALSTQYSSAFRAFAAAGKKLADLHLDYEKLEPWPLQWLYAKDTPLSYRVEKMKLNKEKTVLWVNNSLCLAGIPPEVFEYRLGNRSALDWVIDQYQVSEDKRSGIKSDPNRPDDPEYIVRLVGQVVRVSVETVKLVKGLPKDYGS
jgi:predicted helicase